MKVKWVRTRKGTTDSKPRIGLIEALLLLSAVCLISTLGKRYLSLLFCPFKLITGVPCLLCGMVRSLISFTHFRFLEAFWFNPIACLLYTSLSLYLLYVCISVSLRSPSIRIHLSKGEVFWMKATGVAAVGLNWIYLVLVGR
jgi:hypothetical protein